MTGGLNTDLATVATSLDTAVVAGGACLDPDAVRRARAAMERGLQRLDLGPEHTVVALAGATGSGKSSIFNALAEMDIAEVGARRPLTRQPMACVWGEAGSADLLRWLEVPESRRLQRESVLDADRQAPLHGLVLLDLPDHDSTEVSHQVEVDRLVDQVDLLVWVVDPQKYADDALHSRYLQRLTDHDSVMLVVLNQIDRLGPEEAAACLRDLRRLLDADGLSSVALLPVSARTGAGVEELRSAVAGVVRTHTAMLDRSAADLTAIAHELRRGVADAEPGDGVAPGADALLSGLASSAGVPAVLDAMTAEYRRRGWQFTHWPVLGGLRRLRPDALGRLGSRVQHDDLVLIATALQPVSAPAQRAGVRLAVDAAASATAAGLPPRWAAAVRDAVARPEAELVQALDQAVAAVDLELAPPLSWRLVRMLQLLLALLAAVGAAWLFVVGAVQLAGRRLADPPALLGVPLPVILCFGGLLVGAALALVSRWSIARSALQRRAEADDHLRSAVAAVADSFVLAPITDILRQHRTVRVALDGGPPAVAPPSEAAAPSDFAVPFEAAPVRDVPDAYREPDDESRPELARAFVPDPGTAPLAGIEVETAAEAEVEPDVEADVEADGEPDGSDHDGGPDQTRLAV